MILLIIKMMKNNKVSVALQYNPGEEAPKIIASGQVH